MRDVQEIAGFKIKDNKARTAINDNILKINKSAIIPALYAEVLLPDTYQSYKSMQSGCITDKYIICGVIPEDENNTNTLIVVIDKTTKKVINYIASHKFHHCESMCYAEGYVYIKDGSVNTIYKIAESVFTGSTLTFTETISFTSNLGAICYNYDTDTFYGAENNVLHKLNDDFSIAESYIVNSENDDSVTQGISYVDGKIIFAKIANPTTAFSGEVISKTIITDLEGNILLNYDFTQDVQGELEWAQYWGNGLVLECKYSINGTGRTVDIRFYLTNYFTNYVDNKFTNIAKRYLLNNEVLNSGQAITLYCDKTATNFEVDGTATLPFHDLKHTIEYALSLKSTNNIVIYLKGDYNSQTFDIRNNKTIISLLSIDTNNKAKIGTLNIHTNTFLIENCIAKRINATDCTLYMNGCEVTNSGSTAIFLQHADLIMERANNIHDSYNGINTAMDSTIHSHMNLELSANFGVRLNNPIVLVQSKVKTKTSGYVNINPDNASYFEGIMMLESTSNLNNIKTQGVYSSSQNGYSSISNKPSVNENFSIEIKYLTNTIIKQTLTTFSNVVYQRLYNGSSWTTWKEL